MAAGVAKPQPQKPSVSSSSTEGPDLKSTIATLNRCLQMTAATASSCQEKNANDKKPHSCCPSTSPTSAVVGVEIEKSCIPGDQHMLSNDEPRCGAATERSQQIKIVDYQDETQIGDIMRLITKDLSEPYSIYTYRYFIHGWPDLCLLALDTVSNTYVGAVVCKLDFTEDWCGRTRGYIAMLAVDESCRRLGIGTRLVRRVIENMKKRGCDEVILETEVTNADAMRLYSNLGFIKEKRLFRYYLNGVDAFRLKLYFSPPPTEESSTTLYSEGSN